MYKIYIYDHIYKYICKGNPRSKGIGIKGILVFNFFGYLLLLHMGYAKLYTTPERCEGASPGFLLTGLLVIFMKDAFLGNWQC